MLALVNFKEGKMETFMGWMQSDEGMGCLLYTSPSPRDRG